MKQRARIYYTEAQKAVMWERWQRGDTLHAIAGLFDRGHSSVQRILAETGGIRPPRRRRSGLALTLAEREEISRGVVSGRSRIVTGSLTLNRQPGAQAQWWPATLPSESSRPGGLGPGASPQAL
jgi:IS30 family transposase